MDIREGYIRQLLEMGHFEAIKLELDLAITASVATRPYIIVAM